MRFLMLKIALAAVAILLQTSVGFGCTCAPKRSVLDEFDWAPVVMIARVASLEKAAKQDRQDYDYGVRSSRFVVEKVYKGDVRVGDELVFAQGNGADCLMRFDEESIGRRLLLYTGRSRGDQPWVVSFCGRSTSVEKATEDLLYLDKLDQVRGKTRVSGRYARGFYAGELKVAGWKVRIVGDSDTYETITDENGVFEIYGVPAGNYRLVPELPAGLSIDLSWLGFSGNAIQQQSTDTYVAFTLRPQKHVSIELGFKPKQGKWFSPPK